MLLLVVLPYGMALLFGAVSERWLGETGSAWLAMAGLFFGLYLLQLAVQLLSAA
jgi:hypothetical protein